MASKPLYDQLLCPVLREQGEVRDTPRGEGSSSGPAAAGPGCSLSIGLGCRQTGKARPQHGPESSDICQGCHRSQDGSAKSLQLPGVWA